LTLLCLYSTLQGGEHDHPSTGGGRCGYRPLLSVQLNIDRLQRTKLT
jgi:hypothetical protein